MSRLDSVIRRLSAQRDILNEMPERLKSVPGVVLDLGLGNGRTYDHLRQLFPNREIFAFDRALNAHPDCVPDDEHLILGELEETLPVMRERLAGKVALAHADIGSPDQAVTRRLMAFVGEHVTEMLTRGGIVVADQWISSKRLLPLPLPATVPSGRYHVYMLAG